MDLRSRRAGSVVMDAGRITFAEAPELLLTKTSEDFLSASPSLWAGTGGCAGGGALATAGRGCGTGLPAFACRYASSAGSIGGILASVSPDFGCGRTRNRPVAFTSSALS